MAKLNKLMLVLLCVTIIGGCKKSVTEPPDEPDPRALELIAEGWVEFSQARYDNAFSKFDEALKLLGTMSFELKHHGEALIGRGWARAMLRQFTQSRHDLDQGTGITQVTVTMRQNGEAGLAFVYHVLNQYQLAIQFAEKVLLQQPNYEFQYFPKVNAQRLRVIVAQSAFSLGDFKKTAEQLDILIPENAPHPVDDPEALLMALMEYIDSLTKLPI